MYRMMHHVVVKNMYQNKTNLCLINIWRFIYIDIWPKNFNLSLGEGNNV